jgi:hypothetical protein
MFVFDFWIIFDFYTHTFIKLVRDSKTKKFTTCILHLFLFNFLKN